MFDESTQVTSGDDIDSVFDAVMAPEPQVAAPAYVAPSYATGPVDRRTPFGPPADPYTTGPMPFAPPPASYTTGPFERPFTPPDPAQVTGPFLPVERRTAYTPAPFAPIAPNPGDVAMNARVARLAGLSLDRGSPQSVVAAARPSRPWLTILPWALLVIVIGGGAYYHVTTVQALKDASTAQPVAAAPTVAAKPSGGDSLLASGYVAAKVPIVLSATMAGRLAEVRVDEGDAITKGQILAVISDGALQAELSLANAKLRDASRQLSRTQKLVAAQAATPSDLEKAVGAVEVAQAETRVTQQKIDESKIRSPIDGTVLEVLTHQGEAITIGPSQSAGILRIADLSLLVAEVDVAEAELKRVHVGQFAELTSESQHGHTFRGVVKDIGQQADRARGTVLVKVDILPDLPSTDGSGAVGPAAPPPPRPPPTPEPKKPTAKKQAPAAKVPVKDGVLKPGMAVQVRFLGDPVPEK